MIIHGSHHAERHSVDDPGNGAGSAGHGGPGVLGQRGPEEPAAAAGPEEAAGQDHGILKLVGQVGYLSGTIISGLGMGVLLVLGLTGMAAALKVAAYIVFKWEPSF